MVASSIRMPLLVCVQSPVTVQLVLPVHTFSARACLSQKTMNLLCAKGRMNNSSHFQTGPTLERARFKRSDEAAVPSRVDHRAHDPCGPQLIVYSRDSPYRFQQFPEAPFATRVDVRLLALEPQPEHSDLARRAMQRLPLLNVVHGM